MPQIVPIGGGTRSPYDVIFVNDGGTYRAYNSRGSELSSNSALATLWTAVTAAGQAIHFTAGSYTAAATLTCASGQTITGAGREVTTITKTGTANLFTVAGASGASLINDVHISGLHLTGPSVGGTQVAGSGVYLNYFANCSVQRCEIDGFGSLGDHAAIQTNYGSRATIAFNECHDSKNGICTGAPTATDLRTVDSVIANNICFSNFDDGIHLQCGEHNTVTNNICYGHPNGGASDGAGIDFLGEQYSNISGNVCHTNVRGIEIGNTADDTLPDKGCVVNNNIVEGNTDYGVSIIAGAERCILSNNVIQGNGSNGVRIGTATANQDVIDCVIAENQIHSNGTKGIDVFGYVTRPIIRNNVLSGHSTCDIHIRVSTGTPATVALLDNRTLSATGIDDDVAGAGFVTRLFGA